MSEREEDELKIYRKNLADAMKSDFSTKCHRNLNLNFLYNMHFVFFIYKIETYH